LKAITLYLFFIVLISCNPRVGVFEKNVAIPGHEWSSRFKPEIHFEVSDTSSLYNIYVVVRHTDAYRFNNLWINIYTQAPGDSVANRQSLDLRLANDEKGWLGSGMDDIFEQRILVTRQPVALAKAGVYRFTLENIMREDPLEGIMNAGIRVERAR
jgi:gliding motility-associated lipoprotein GldH